MKKQELNNKVASVLNEKEPEKSNKIAYLIKEIKIQRQETMNNPTSGNILSTIIWYDTLLAEIEKEAA